MITQRETLGLTRLMLVVSGLSPLYILWMLRGMRPIPDTYLIGGGVTLVIVSYAFLWGRICRAKRQNDRKELTIASPTDHREHLLTYLVAVMLPLYDANLGSFREALAGLGAFLFVVFIFWHMQLHYINPVFAVLDYRIFSFEGPGSAAPLVLITRKHSVRSLSNIRALRLSNTVYLDDQI